MMGMSDIFIDSVFIDFNFNLESKICDIKDCWDFVYFFIRCEEVYEIVLFDLEVCILETKNLSFRQLDEFINFLKSNIITEFIHSFIINNINELKGIREVYLDYIISNRNNKIDLLIGKKDNF